MELQSPDIVSVKTRHKIVAMVASQNDVFLVCAAYIVGMYKIEPFFDAGVIAEQLIRL